MAAAIAKRLSPEGQPADAVLLDIIMPSRAGLNPTHSPECPAGRIAHVRLANCGRFPPLPDQHTPARWRSERAEPLIKRALVMFDAIPELRGQSAATVSYLGGVYRD